MKATTKIWCNSNYVKNSASGPNSSLLNSFMKEVSICPYLYPYLLGIFCNSKAFDGIHLHKSKKL